MPTAKTKSAKRTPHITKALFEAGQQCPLRLWRDFHEPKSIPPLSEGRQKLANTGDELVKLAQTAFPTGERVEGADGAARAEATDARLKDGGVAALFDAAFEADGVLVETDILLMNSQGELDLFEVKSGTKVKPRHIMDLALQVHVIEANGFKVRAATVLNLNPQYRLPEGGSLQVHMLFRNRDVTDRVRKRVGAVAQRLEQMRGILDQKDAPELPMGTWCNHPFRCHHWDRCHAAGPDRPLAELIQLSTDQEKKLRGEGVVAITDLATENATLTDDQRREVQAIQTDSLVIEPFVGPELVDLELPAHFVSLLYLKEVVPAWPGTRPWTFLPYAFAAVSVAEDGSVTETSYVEMGKDDPRPNVIRRLHALVAEQGSMVTLGDQYLSRLRALLEEMPDEKTYLRAILHVPSLELGTLCAAGVAHPGLRGQHNLDRYAKALLNETPDGLEFSDELAAANEWRRVQKPRIRKATKDKAAEDIAAFALWQARCTHGIWKTLKEQAPEVEVVEAAAEAAAEGGDEEE